jgi:HSP20 family protein
MNAVMENETQSVRPERAQRPYVAPGVNIVETKDAFVLQAEMPGVSKEGLDIHLENNVLTLEGRRQAREIQGAPLYRESSGADYRRVFELDPAIDGSRITAHIEQGVLTVQLPKAERVKPRKIKVS